MRIGIDATYLANPLNGIGQVTTHFVDALCASVRRGPVAASLVDDFRREFLLFVTHPTGRTYPAGFREVVIPLKRYGGPLSRKWWECVQLPRSLRHHECDAFFSLYQSGTVLPPSIKHLMMIHDLIYLQPAELPRDWRRKVSLWLMLRGMRRAGRYLVNSECTKGDLISQLGIDSDRIRVAHIAADPTFCVAPTPEKQLEVMRKYSLEPGYIYHGGGLDRRKNARGVLFGYAEIRRRLGKERAVPRLVISGRYGGDVSRLSPVTEWVKELGLEESVSFLGEVPAANLPALYHGARLFLFPSYYEGFGLPVLEAMHAGVPVVTSRCSALPEVAGDAAVYCDPADSSSIAHAAEQVLLSPELAASLSAAGRRRAAAFDWESFVGAVLEELER